MLEEKVKGLLEVEEIGGSCAGNKERFRELPLELLGDFAGYGVGGEMGGEGDVFR